MKIRSLLLAGAKKISQAKFTNKIISEQQFHSDAQLPLNEQIKLCYVTDRKDRSIEWQINTIEKAVAAGVTMVQIREKPTVADREICKLAELVMKKLESFSIPLIINDRVDICKQVGAHGVHLGQSDMHPEEARGLLGNHCIIGYSVENILQMDKANKLDSIDYVAASPVFHSNTKNDYTSLWGINGLKLLTKFSRHPVMAIGGINETTVKEVMEAGCKGVAVVSAIQKADIIELAVKTLLNEVNQNLRAEKNYVRSR